MHELSLAINIVEICEQTALQNNASVITSLTLDVGKLSGVVMEALETAMESAITNTIMQNATIHYNLIQGMAQCAECGNKFDVVEIYEECPVCNSYKSSIIAGKELTVSSIDIE